MTNAHIPSTVNTGIRNQDQFITCSLPYHTVYMEKVFIKLILNLHAATSADKLCSGLNMKYMFEIFLENKQI